MRPPTQFCNENKEVYRVFFRRFIWNEYLKWNSHAPTEKRIIQIPSNLSMSAKMAILLLIAHLIWPLANLTPYKWRSYFSIKWIFNKKQNAERLSICFVVNYVLNNSKEQWHYHLKEFYSQFCTRRRYFYHVHNSWKNSDCNKSK